MIERTHDAILIRAMLLQPEVAPNMTWGSDLDAGIADDRNVVLVDGASAAIFEWSAPNVYEGHMLFLPPIRGRLAITRGAAFLREMFAAYGARMIWGRVKEANRAARWIARQLGFASAGMDRGHELFVLEA